MDTNVKWHFPIIKARKKHVHFTRLRRTKISNEVRNSDLDTSEFKKTTAYNNTINLVFDLWETTHHTSTHWRK